MFRVFRSAGEHREWCKQTNFELATHAPMMIHDPDLTKAGIQVERLTEFVDLFPTLVELAGFEPLTLCPEDSSKVELCTEGMSMVPLFKNPTNAAWKSRVFSQHPRDRNHVRESLFALPPATCEQRPSENDYNHYMGYSMRTERFRYREWVRFTGKPQYKIHWDKLQAAELYDYVTDPLENVNLINDKSFRNTIKKLSKMLREDWRSAMP